MKFDLIAFDADDTLWHNETLYAEAQGKLRELLSRYADGETVDQWLYEKEIITKGDLLDQQSKLWRSGLGDCFRYVEVVSQKTQSTYEALLAKYKIKPQRFLMVGNSLKSDILPVLALGGYAVYIPYHITWTHETVDSQHVGHDRYHELEHLGQLPRWLHRRDASRSRTGSHQ